MYSGCDAARVVVFTCVRLLRAELTDLSCGLVALSTLVLLLTTVLSALLLVAVVLLVSSSDAAAVLLLEVAVRADADLLPLELVYLLDRVLYELLRFTGVE